MNRQPSSTTPARRTLSLQKKLLFSVFVLAIICLPLVAFETFLIVTDWNEARASGAETRDPFLGFSGEESLFEENDSNGYFQIRESRLGYFRPARFLARKPENGFRVFVVGGSTVQGRPWETETSFAQWLELAMGCCEPKSTIEVINCGGVSYASYRLSRIIDEVVEYDPDLIILCTGHNEFLEQRTYGREASMPAAALAIHRFLSLSKTYRWARSQVLNFRGPEERPVLGQQVITRLDYENGLELFNEQTLERKSVRGHFRFQLEKMIQTVCDRGIRMMVVSPPCNLKDCFPFKPTPNWQPEQRSRFADLSRSELQSIPPDERTADYFFLRGQKELVANNMSQAKKDFLKAIDLDLCPIRMTSSLRQAMEEAARGAQKKYGLEQLLYLDLMSRCEAESNYGIIGDDLLVDHVHPSIQSHRKIAKWIVSRLQQRQLIFPREAWEEKFEKQADAHLQSLDFGYFQRGKERLASVLKWSRGQAIDPLKRNE